MTSNRFSSFLFSFILFLTLVISGCGGSSSDDEKVIDIEQTATVLSGKVADGYISGAIVCLDINKNKECDSGEPSDITGAGGVYSFDTTEEDVAAYPIVAEIPATALDEDDGGAAIGHNYVLTAPAGSITTGVMITPLTTLVQNQLEDNPAITTAQAETQILNTMGVTDTSVSLLDDYVEKSDTGTNSTNAADYERLHMIAQATATSIANNMYAIQGVVAAGGTTIVLTIDDLIGIIVDEVVAALWTMVTAVDTAITAGQDSSTFDETIAIITTKIDTATDVDTAITEENLEDTATTVSSLQAVFEVDSYSFESDSQGSGFEYAAFKIDYVNGRIDELDYSYDLTNSVWLLVPDEDEFDLQLTADGWLDDANEVLTFSEASGVLSMTGSLAGVSGNHDTGSTTLSLSETDLSGQNIMAYMSGEPDRYAGFVANMNNANAVFPTGSKTYEVTYTDTGTLTDYTTWSAALAPDGWCDPTGKTQLNGFCNFVYGKNHTTDPTSFDDIFMTVATDVSSPLSYAAYAGKGVTGGSTAIGTDIVVEYIRVNANDTSGVMRVLEVDASGNLQLLATHSWSMVSAFAQQIMLSGLSDAQEILLENQGYDLVRVDANKVMFVYLGFLREGEYYPPGSTGSFVQFNQVAADAMLAAAGLTDTSGNTPTPQPSASSALHGTWIAANATNLLLTPDVLTFLSDNRYVHSGSCDDPALIGTTAEGSLPGNESVDITAIAPEYGTYSWNSVSGALNGSVTLDANGWCGLSDDLANGQVNLTISGDVMTLVISDWTRTLYRVVPTANPIVGSWIFLDNPYVEPFTFFDNGYYTYPQICDDSEYDDSPAPAVGVEYGSYNWNQTTGDLTGTIIVDTNGWCGLYSPGGALREGTGTVIGDQNFTIEGDVMTLHNGDGDFPLHRIQ